MFHKIKTVKPLRGFLLWTEFLDGAETIYDVSKLFDALPAFRTLENVPGLFEQVQVDTGGYGVSWNDELDLDADELRANGMPLRDVSVLDSGSPCPTCGRILRRKNEGQSAVSRVKRTTRRSKGGPACKRKIVRKKKADAATS